MNLMQSPSTGPSSAGPNLMMQVWRQAGPLIAAALMAQVVIVVLTELAAPAPLLTAMLATAAFAGVWLGLSRRPSAATPSVRSGWGEPLYAAGITTTAVFLGSRLLAGVFGDGRAFYCEPAVPWRIEIAIFGSFAIPFLTRMAEVRGRARLVYPLTLIAFLWIAPFYGFFVGPVFLAIGLVAGCADRSLISVLLAGLGMIVGERLGIRLAAWLSTSSGSQ
jgi:hypothetical protein